MGYKTETERKVAMETNAVIFFEKEVVANGYKLQQTFQGHPLSPENSVSDSHFTWGDLPKAQCCPLVCPHAQRSWQQSPSLLLLHKAPLLPSPGGGGSTGALTLGRVTHDTLHGRIVFKCLSWQLALTWKVWGRDQRSTFSLYRSLSLAPSVYIPGVQFVCIRLFIRPDTSRPHRGSFNPTSTYVHLHDYKVNREWRVGVTITWIYSYYGYWET